MKILMISSVLIGMLIYRLFGDGYLDQIDNSIIVGILVFIVMATFQYYMRLKRFYKNMYRLDI